METSELYLSRSGNTRMLNGIFKKRLSSKLRLATEKEKKLTTET